MDMASHLRVLDVSTTNSSNRRIWWGYDWQVMYGMLSIEKGRRLNLLDGDLDSHLMVPRIVWICLRKDLWVVLSCEILPSSSCMIARYLVHSICKWLFSMSHRRAHSIRVGNCSTMDDAWGTSAGIAGMFEEQIAMGERTKGKCQPGHSCSGLLRAGRPSQPRVSIQTGRLWSSNQLQNNFYWRHTYIYLT